MRVYFHFLIIAIHTYTTVHRQGTLRYYSFLQRIKQHGPFVSCQLIFKRLRYKICAKRFPTHMNMNCLRVGKTYSMREDEPLHLAIEKENSLFFKA